MNTQVCTATKKTPYELVFGQEPRSGFALMKELYDQGIRNKEDIPDNVTVQNSENVREGLGESIVLNDSAASNNEDNDESGTYEIDVPESESAPMPSYVMSMNVREGSGESIVLNDSAASNDEDNDESGTHEIDVPESESTPTPSYVMSTNHEEFRKVATENVKKSIERMRAVSRK